MKPISAQLFKSDFDSNSSSRLNARNASTAEGCRRKPRKVKPTLASSGVDGFCMADIIERQRADERPSTTGPVSKRSGLFSSMPKSNQSKLPSMEDKVRDLKMKKDKNVRGYKIYDFEKFTERGYHAVKTMHATWEIMDRANASSTYLVKREDIADLKYCFDRMVEFMKDTSLDGVSKDSAMAEDFNGWKRKAEIKHEFYHEHAVHAFAAQHILQYAVAVFEQKWTDLFLGEIQDQLQVAFLEQGNLMASVRMYYAKAFDHAMKIHDSVLELLKKSLERNAKDLLELKELQHAHRLADQHAKEKYDVGLKKMNMERLEEQKHAEMQVKEAQMQVQETNETMKALNAIFKQMRDDAETIDVMSMKDRNHLLEKRNDVTKEEIDKLRPCAPENERLKSKVAQQDEEINKLRNELNKLQEDLMLKNGMLENFIQAQGERMQNESDSAEETEMASPPLEKKASMNNMQNEEIPIVRSYLCIRCKETLDTAADTDEAINGPPKPVRQECAAYRIMLPNLNGKRPMKERSWTFGCMRALLYAKLVDDSISSRAGRLRVRFSEFAFSWFSPTVEDGYDSNEMLAMEEEADIHRWAMYYGSKSLAAEFPEAQIFYTLLDEKYGDDEMVFALYCLRVLNAQSPGLLNWNNYHNYVSYHAYQRFLAENGSYIPIKVFVSLSDATAALATVLSRANQAEKQFFIRQMEEAIESEDKTNGALDAFFWLQLMLNEYREEQAHRRASIKLMFQMATASGDASEGPPVLNMDQFTSMLTALNRHILPHEIASLYRKAYYTGDYTVTYQSFLQIAEDQQFFASCLDYSTILGHVTAEAVDADAKHAETTVGFIVNKHFTIFRSQLEAFLPKLSPAVKSNFGKIMNQLVSILRQGTGYNIKGIKALYAYRRLLDLLMQERMSSRELHGEVMDEEFPYRVDKEISLMQQLILHKAQADETVAFLATIRRNISVARVQNSFRARLNRDQGAPLSMRQIMHAGYGADKSKIRKKRALHSFPWLLSSIRNLILERIRKFQFESVNENDAPKSPRINEFNNFIYEYYLYQLGSRWEAERKIDDLFINVRAQLKLNHDRILLFSKLAGMGQEDEDMYFTTQNAFTFLAFLIQTCFHESDTFRTTYFASGGDSNSPMAADEAQCILNKLFVKKPTQGTQIMKKLSKNSDILIPDKFIMFMMMEWRKYIVKRLNQVSVACYQLETKLFEIDGFFTMDMLENIFKNTRIEANSSQLAVAFRNVVVIGTENQANRMEIKDKKYLLGKIIRACFDPISTELLGSQNGDNYIPSMNWGHQLEQFSEAWESYTLTIRAMVLQIKNCAIAQLSTTSSATSMSPLTPLVEGESLEGSSNVATTDLFDQVNVFESSWKAFQADFESFTADTQVVSDTTEQMNPANADRLGKLWIAFRQLVCELIRLRSIAHKENGPLVDKWDLDVEKD